MSLAHRSPWQIFRSVLFALFIRELRTRFGGFRLGYAWALIEPVVHVVLISLMFSLRGRGGVFGIEMPVFVLVGIMPFDFFSKCFSQSQGAISGNQGLFIYKQLKPFDVICMRWILEFMTHGLAFIVLLAIGAWIGYAVIPHDPLGLLCVAFLLAAFCLGTGLLVAVATDMQSELKKVMPFITRPLYFISGIFFPLALLPQNLHPFLLWNPLLHYIELARFCFFPNYPMAGADWGFASMSALIALAGGLTLYWRYRTVLVST